MTWNPLDEPIDYIVLSGVRSPGLAEVTGAAIDRRWDKRPGYDGPGFAVFHGTDLAEFSVKLRLYTAQDWADWKAFKPLVAKPPIARQGKSRSLQIVHPLLEELAIKSVVVKSILQPEQEDDGVWVIEIKFMQWREPKPQLAKPEGSTAAPVDPVEQDIGKLNDQAEDLARQLNE